MLKQLFDKPLFRDIHLLELLIRSSTCEESFLLNTLSITKKTLLKAVTELNQRLGPGATIHYQCGHLHLSADEAFNLNAVIATYMEDSLIHHFMTQLFYGEKISVPALAEKFQVSVSTIYRQIQSANELLKNYDLRIRSHFLELIGNEADIRLFFYYYFWSGFRGQKWPFPVSKETILASENTRLNEMLLHLTPPQQEQFLFFSAIALIRRKQKKFVQQAVSRYLDNPLGKYLDVLPDFFLHAVPSPFSKTESSYNLAVLEAFDFLRKDIATANEVLHYHRTNKTLVFQASETIMAYCVSIVADSDKEKLTPLVQAYIISILCHHIYFHGMYAEIVPFYDDVPRQNNYFEAKVELFIPHLLEKYPYLANGPSTFIKKRLIDLLYAYLPAASYRPTIQLQVYTDIPLVKNIVIQQLEQLGFLLTVLSEYESFEKCDLIISNTPISGQEKKTYLFYHRYLSEYDKIRLQHLLTEIEKKKRAHI